MLSKGHLHLKKLLETFCKLHELELMTEVKEGDLRYDFYIPTSPPLVLEFNGIQHKMDSPDGFFFKTTQDLLHYKKNDSFRKQLHKSGRIILIEIEDENIEYDTLEKILLKYQEIIKKGSNNKNAHFKRIVSDRERKKEFQRKTSERRKEFAKQLRNRDRSK